MIIDAVQCAGSYVDGTRILNKIKLVLSDKYREKYLQMLALDLHLCDGYLSCGHKVLAMEHAEYGGFIGFIYNLDITQDSRMALDAMFERFDVQQLLEWLTKMENLN